MYNSNDDEEENYSRNRRSNSSDSGNGDGNGMLNDPMNTYNHYNNFNRFHEQNMQACKIDEIYVDDSYDENGSYVQKGDNLSDNNHFEVSKNVNFDGPYSYKNLREVTENEVELVVDNFFDRIRNNEDVYSEWKVCPNFIFRLLFIAKSRSNNYMYPVASSFIEAIAKDDWVPDWGFSSVQYYIILINLADYRKSYYKIDHFSFSHLNTDRGWHNFVPFEKLREPGFINENGQIVLRAGVFPLGSESFKNSRDINYDSKSRTGFVGLQNHGATCYMNALLQLLYHINIFRKAVCMMIFNIENIIGEKTLEFFKKKFEKKKRRKKLCLSNDKSCTTQMVVEGGEVDSKNAMNRKKKKTKFEREDSSDSEKYKGASPMRMVPYTPSENNGEEGNPDGDEQKRDGDQHGMHIQSGAFGGPEVIANANESELYGMGKINHNIRVKNEDLRMNHLSRSDDNDNGSTNGQFRHSNEDPLGAPHNSSLGDGSPFSGSPLIERPYDHLHQLQADKLENVKEKKTISEYQQMYAPHEKVNNNDGEEANEGAAYQPSNVVNIGRINSSDIANIPNIPSVGAHEYEMKNNKKHAYVHNSSSDPSIDTGGIQNNLSNNGSGEVYYDNSLYKSEGYNNEMLTTVNCKKNKKKGMVYESKKNLKKKKKIFKYANEGKVEQAENNDHVMSPFSSSDNLSNVSTMSKEKKKKKFASNNNFHLTGSDTVKKENDSSVNNAVGYSEGEEGPVPRDGECSSLGGLHGVGAEADGHMDNSNDNNSGVDDHHDERRGTLRGDEDGSYSDSDMSVLSITSSGSSSYVSCSSTSSSYYHKNKKKTKYDKSKEIDYKNILLEEENEKKNILPTSLALQNLFYKLHCMNEAVSCKELIRSFGWDASDVFTQQDTHELLKLLLDKVEEQMKGTVVEGSVKKMFEGEVETYIECLDIDYKSVRKETYEDIQLDVQGCNNIYESLDKAIEAEVLEGDNIYETDGYGKQKAKKGMRFLSFPNICIFLLKRFTFDLQRMETVKLNNRFEFYKELDLSKYCQNGGEYVLQAVSVHQGNMNSGHYYSFSYKHNENFWLKCDDDKIFRVSEYSVINDNFGGYDINMETDLYDFDIADKIKQRMKHYSAYMLVYVKKSLIPKLIKECDPAVVNPQVVKRCRMEEIINRRRTKLKQEILQYVKIRVFDKYSYLYKSFSDLPPVGIPSLFNIKFDRNKTVLETFCKILKIIKKIYLCKRKKRADYLLRKSTRMKMEKADKVPTQGDHSTSVLLKSEEPAEGGDPYRQALLGKHMKPGRIPKEERDKAGATSSRSDRGSSDGNGHNRSAHVKSQEKGARTDLSKKEMSKRGLNAECTTPEEGPHDPNDACDNPSEEVPSQNCAADDSLSTVSSVPSCCSTKSIDKYLKYLSKRKNERSKRRSSHVNNSRMKSFSSSNNSSCYSSSYLSHSGEEDSYSSASSSSSNSYVKEKKCFYVLLPTNDVYRYFPLDMKINSQLYLYELLKKTNKESNDLFPTIDILYLPYNKKTSIRKNNSSTKNKNVLFFFKYFDIYAEEKIGDTALICLDLMYCDVYLKPKELESVIIRKILKAMKKGYITSYNYDLWRSYLNEEEEYYYVDDPLNFKIFIEYKNKCNLIKSKKIIAHNKMVPGDILIFNFLSNAELEKKKNFIVRLGTRKEDLFLTEENQVTYDLFFNADVLSKILYRKKKLIEKMHNCSYIVSNKNGVYYKVSSCESDAGECSFPPVPSSGVTNPNGDPPAGDHSQKDLLNDEYFVNGSNSNLMKKKMKKETASELPVQLDANVDFAPPNRMQQENYFTYGDDQNGENTFPRKEGAEEEDHSDNIRLASDRTEGTPHLGQKEGAKEKSPLQEVNPALHAEHEDDAKQAPRADPSHVMDEHMDDVENGNFSALNMTKENLSSQEVMNLYLCLKKLSNKFEKNGMNYEYCLLSKSMLMPVKEAALNNKKLIFKRKKKHPPNIYNNECVNICRDYQYPFYSPPTSDLSTDDEKRVPQKGIQKEEVKRKKKKKNYDEAVTGLSRQNLNCSSAYAQNGVVNKAINAGKDDEGQANELVYKCTINNTNLLGGATDGMNTPTYNSDLKNDYRYNSNLRIPSVNFNSSNENNISNDLIARNDSEISFCSSANSDLTYTSESTAYYMFNAEESLESVYTNESAAPRNSDQYKGKFFNPNSEDEKIEAYVDMPNPGGTTEAGSNPNSGGHPGQNVKSGVKMEQPGRNHGGHNSSKDSENPPNVDQAGNNIIKQGDPHRNNTDQVGHVGESSGEQINRNNSCQKAGEKTSDGKIRMNGEHVSDSIYSYHKNRDGGAQKVICEDTDIDEASEAHMNDRSRALLHENMNSINSMNVMGSNENVMAEAANIIGVSSNMGVPNLMVSNDPCGNAQSSEPANDSLVSSNAPLGSGRSQANRRRKNRRAKIIKKCGGQKDKEEPILPFYVICDYLDFVERKIYVNRFRFKLYDPIYQLGKYRNCAGVVLKKNLKKSCLNYIDSNFIFLKKELCKIDLDIDIRCPTKQIFKHVCYRMNVDPTHVLIFPYPPLNSPINFNPYNIDSFTSNSDSDGESYQKNSNSTYGPMPFETLIKQHAIALEHNSLTEQKTFCLSLLPFHYKYFTRLYPEDSPKYFHYVVHLFNANVQSVAAFTGHIKLKKSLPNKNKGGDNYFQGDADSSSEASGSSMSDRSSSTMANRHYLSNNYTTVQDLIDKIKLEINPYLKKRGIDVKQKFRLLFTFGPKIKYLSHNEQLIQMDFVKTNHIKNVYVTPLRMEPDFTDEQKHLIETDQLKIIHVFNQTPSKEVFGYSFDVLVDPNDNMLDIKNRIRKRTLLPKYIFDKITFFEFENGQRIWRSNEDTINWKNKQFAIIIGEHHAPSQSKPQMGMKIA
ncbi:Ubiquitin carboxyl-terminal hydrolase [Plasmodium coatneyi]|uniref:ubiquitinyl hydrolase 1 n=1 Tax=Plasmodium coatneyi TaxID=208452 RepID=A0A1B1DT28_9APIC|nr:Ubiquitin carboxyl-terminal hydrolase [Plasmodium coatneyi]ANQ05930.1 Ubiquitin carboxyl-terminal hydrolase [Plasmodium coatneyi]